MSDTRPRPGLISRIASRLIGGKDGEARPVVAGLRNQRESPPESNTPDDFRLAIDQMLQEDQGRFGIRPHVISLVEYREAVGERWKKISDKVMMIAEGVINLHLGPGNIFSRQGSDFFMLVFRSTHPDEARRRALIIAQELGTRLVGDQFEGIDIPLALAAEVSLDDMFKTDGTLNLAAVHSAVSEVRSMVAPTGAPRAARAESPPVPKPGRPPIESLPHEMKDLPRTDPRWQEFSQKRDKAADPQWKSLENQPKAPPVPPPPPMSEYGAMPMTGAARMAVVWRPTWCADGECIGAYKAQVLRSDYEGQPPLEGSHAYSNDDFTAHSLDRFVVAAGVRDMLASEKAGNGSVVVLPLHWRTLTSDNRMDLLAPFADLPKPLRDARLVIDLFGIPDDAGQTQLSEVIAINRQLARDVVVRARLGRSRAELLVKCGATAVGVDLAELPPNQKTDDPVLLAWLAEFRDAAGWAGLKTYVWSIRRRHALVGAVQGGFDMVNGPALMKDLPRPAKVLPAPRARFTLSKP
jgi:hypothetical protein